MSNVINVDFAILGGGISGLWTLACLKKLGYHTILLESSLLGAGQTLNSQGIIHGGIKYTLKGLLSNSYKQMANLPSRWQKHLQGELHPDLSNVEILENKQYLWSHGNLASNFFNFLASKFLTSEVTQVAKKDYPSIFQFNNFKGNVYNLHENILHMPSLIANIVEPYKEYCLHADATVNHLDGKTIDNLCYSSAGDEIKIKAKHYIFMAGNGNIGLTKRFSPEPDMQYRPLHMVMVKGKNLPNFYGHNIDGNLNPVVTISTHKCKDGENVWYLGGELAESGVNLLEEQQIAAAKNLLQSLFKDDLLQDVEWNSFKINRAEAYQHNLQRPEGPDFTQYINSTVAWPTKMTFAPLLTDSILASASVKAVTKSNEIDETLLNELPKAKIGRPLWQDFIIEKEHYAY